MAIRTSIMSAEKFHFGTGTAERREREKTLPVVFARKRFLTFGAISIFLILFVGETSLQKGMVVHTWYTQRLSSTAADECQYQDLQQQQQLDIFSNASKLILISKPTVHEAYETKVTNISNLTSLDHQARRRPKNQKFKTVIEPNRNVIQYGLTGMRNVCMRPSYGALVMVGISEEEILAQVSEVPALKQEWYASYNCSKDWGCVGVEKMTMENIPADVKWVPGSTTHIMPYLQNVFHHFADRVWPHIVGFQYPLNESTPHPIDHFLVHRFSTWLFQAGHNMDRNTLMYQIRLLGGLAPKADFLVMDGLEPHDLVCYERFVLACTTCDRMSDKLGYNITKPAVLRYRDAALSYFGIREPLVPLPPRPLRVTFYARWDTKRRRVANAQEVVDHLRAYKSPRLVVTYIDELMAAGEYNQSLPEVVSLLSQTDIFITVHGANTWAAVFMPKHAAVIEIEGPCGPASWLKIIVNAVDLKHDTSNPWGAAVATPDSGNTTECKGYYETPDFTLDFTKLDDAIHRLALPTFGVNDRIPRHWLYNWVPNS